MKTIFIWDDYQCPITFFIIDGDYRHLDGVYINREEDKSKVEQLQSIIGTVNHSDSFDKFPVDAVKSDTVVIVAGLVEAC